MKAYIQSSKLSDNLHENAQDARLGFQLRGYEIVPYSIVQLREGDFDDELLNDKENIIFYGGVGTIREAVRRAGRPMPPMLDLPESLKEFWGRECWHSTLGEVRRSFSGSTSEPIPVHIKPLEHHKLFTGRVIREFKDLIPSAHAPAETSVLVQTLVDFVSEWRATVLRGSIINVANYKGDPLSFPDRAQMEDGLEAFRGEGPIAYAMDWGVTSTGATCLVEVNDSFSLGNYGLRCLEYVQILEARWRQLMGLEDRG
jgi:hypothetical protein